MAGRGAFAERQAAKRQPSQGRYDLDLLPGQSLRLSREDAKAATRGVSGGTLGSPAAYSHARFHQALLGLGSPPLGLMARALDTR